MRRILESARYFSLIGVGSLLIASIATFCWGAVKTYVALDMMLSGAASAEIVIALIVIVDTFLIATALFVFAASMYELFVDKLSLPAWMLAHNLHELKAKLSSMIILVMAVKFLERLIEWPAADDVLFMALAVAAVSAILIALAHFGKKD